MLRPREQGRVVAQQALSLFFFSSDLQPLPEVGLGKRRCCDGLEEAHVDLHRLQHLHNPALVVGQGVILEEFFHLLGDGASGSMAGSYVL